MCVIMMYDMCVSQHTRLSMQLLHLSLTTGGRGDQPADGILEGRFGRNWATWAPFAGDLQSIQC